MIGQPPRYALDEPVFPFPALAASAGRAALGGAREVTLACLMAGRLAAALLDPFEILPESHRDRSGRARQWSATLALPADVRAMLMRVIELSGRADPAAVAAAMGDLISVAGGSLDESSRAELQLVARRLAEAREEVGSE